MAYTSAAALIADIKQEVGRIGNKIARGVAQVAFEEMQDAHSQIMDSFYAGYTPVESYTYYCYKDGQFYSGRSHGYRRTYNFRSNTLHPIGVSGGGHTFTATIAVDGSSMDDYVNNTGHTFPGSAVFDLIWEQGIRGLPPGNRGYVGKVFIQASPAGVPIAGKPSEAMQQFVDQWPLIRGPEVADIIASSV